ncbi:hypothetical protein [Methylobrevis albus]|uniref:Uncharacterized protein n=1 Tax=Methylobrevis albus TaxID=2793297 RepID=A0A931I4F4_9HYPH|nr:hypothetical protein [Methylobrevis albus]MBH0239324.1 hypothetical protein [Methylobrevis albus]
MIERIMFFVVGALSAGILALLVLPAFTWRAARLARRDVEARLPISLTEFSAQKDAQRAVFAAEVARLEVRAETAEEKGLGLSLQIEALQRARAAAEASQRDAQMQAAELQQKIAALRADLATRDEALGRATAALREVRWRLAAPDGSALRPDIAAEPASEAAADDVAAALAALRQGIAADAPPPRRATTLPPTVHGPAGGFEVAHARPTPVADASAMRPKAGSAADGPQKNGQDTPAAAPDAGDPEHDEVLARALADIRTLTDDPDHAPQADDGAPAPADAAPPAATDTRRFAGIARRLRPAAAMDKAEAATGDSSPSNASADARAKHPAV